MEFFGFLRPSKHYLYNEMTFKSVSIDQNCKKIIVKVSGCNFVSHAKLEPVYVTDKLLN